MSRDVSDKDMVRKSMTTALIEKPEKENAILRKKLQALERAAHRFCPDCIDKVKHEPCLRCQRDKWKKKYEDLLASDYGIDAC